MSRFRHDISLPNKTRLAPVIFDVGMCPAMVRSRRYVHRVGERQRPLLLPRHVAQVVAAPAFVVRFGTLAPPGAVTAADFEEAREKGAAGGNADAYYSDVLFDTVGLMLVWGDICR